MLNYMGHTAASSYEGLNLPFYYKSLKTGQKYTGLFSDISYNSRAGW